MLFVGVGEDFGGVQVDDQWIVGGGPGCGVAGAAGGPGGSTGRFHPRQDRRGAVRTQAGEFCVAAMHRGV
ncbi:hypothetical protein NQ042_12935 [Corynebacterium phoceense]|nr:hypothetical protein [Corynebacterium phoceense]MCQ9332358.1 hypothetical protein [Corynebacterium phoceense]MCQ9334970.1 hypothetical protein [Corynebacterium phoceense]MCQ9341901.1 hypothetical protein [Corynebacterium phoceense]MCQ9349233.1 hypothetical protein [Corynebacterium phoceense]